MLHRQVGQDVGSGNVGIQLYSCCWHLDILHLEYGVFFQLLQFSITNLVCSNSGRVEEGRRHSTDVMGEYVSWGVLTAFDVAEVSGEL